MNTLKGPTGVQSNNFNKLLGLQASLITVRNEFKIQRLEKLFRITYIYFTYTSIYYISPDSDFLSQQYFNC